MRPLSPTRTRGSSGVTLAELLVVTSVLSILLTSLCGIYLAMISQWQRQQGQGDSLVATSRTFTAVSSELSQAITVDCLNHQGAHGTIVYTLPLDKDATNTYYVPKWVNGTLQYRPGQQKVFYLSDSTGQFDHTGNILWRGIISGSYPFSYSITPDPAWDADPQRGQISPIDSLSFDSDNWGHPLRLTVTVNTSYTTGDSTASISRSLSVFLRNAN